MEVGRRLAATRDRRLKSSAARLSLSLWFVRLAVAFGEAAWCAAVRRWFVGTEVDPLGVATITELFLW
jgi:hypothetical protein